MPLPVAETREAARGQWRQIMLALLPQLADAIAAGPGRHVECPKHGGENGDAFRIFDDFDETGGCVCNTCGKLYDGFATLTWLNETWKFDDALKAVAEFLGIKSAGPGPRKRGRPRKATTPAPSTNGHTKSAIAAIDAETQAAHAKVRAQILARWQQAKPDTGRIAAYLQYRGLSLPSGVPPTLRISRQVYYDADGRPLGEFPCMLAMLASEANGIVGLHRTYLSIEPPGKAPVNPAKKFSAPIYPGALTGGAIRLFPSAGPTLAIAEGIETALAVHQATGLPTWAAGSAGNLAAVEIPAGKKHQSSPIRRVELWIDPGKAGEDAGQSAAARLTAAGFEVVVICPTQPDVGDWLDVLNQFGAEALIAAQSDAKPFTRPPDQLPRIVIRTKEHAMVDDAVSALKRCDYIFQRGGVLVHVVRDAAPLAGVTRPKGVPRITILPMPRLRERLSAVADWFKPVFRNGESVEVPSRPDTWAVSQVAARGEWPGVRHLEAITEAPTLRPDGSIIDQPGYDPSTGVLYEPSCSFPAIPAAPSNSDIESAVATILDVVTDFPFQTPAHRAAWVASCLTPLARFAFAGPSPLFLMDANIRGAGKSLLCDLVSLITHGRDFARMPNTRADDEMRKRITSIALAGEPIVLLDNVSDVLGCSALDAALTATTWSDRLLGKNESTQQIPMLSTWFATGNNVILRGDLARRTLHIRLESPYENPERRDEFKHPAIKSWILRERGAIVAACLTILRGYFAAGRPKVCRDRWGSFEGWSDVVRSAVVWAGLPDPGDTRQELESDADSEVGSLHGLLNSWHEVDPNGDGITVAELLSKLAEEVEKFLPDPFSKIRNAISEICFSKNGKLPNSRSVSMKLHHLRGRVIGGKCLKSKRNTENTTIWTVCSTINSTGTTGASGTIPSTPYISEKNQEVIKDKNIIEAVQVPAVPVVPELISEEI